MSEIWFRLRRDPKALIGAIILAIIVLIAIFAPWIAPHDPNERHEEGKPVRSVGFDAAGGRSPGCSHVSWVGFYFEETHLGNP